MQAIVFVPGISGSELIYKNQSPPIWPPNLWDIPVYQELGELLDPKNNAVGNVIDAVLFLVPVYQTTENDLRSISNSVNAVPGGAYFPSPYDWRIDLLTAVDSLADRIATFANSPGVTEITIVAHSMGGLLTRLLLEWKRPHPPWFRKISRALFICTPHLGAPTALARIFGLEVTEYVIQPSQMRQLADNSHFPAVYQLLPPPDNNILYDTIAKKYIPYNDQTVIKAFGLSKQNLKAASKYGQALNSANKPKLISYFFVYGTGQSTDEGVEVAGLSPNGAVPWQDDQGDGTVPSWSIVRAAGQFSPNIPMASFPGSHIDILRTDAFRKFLYSYFGLGAPAPLVTDAAGVVVSLNKRTYSAGETIHVLIIPDEEANLISGSLILYRISPETRVANVLGVRQEVMFRGGPVRFLASKLIAPTTPGLYRLEFGGINASHKTSSEVAGWFVVLGTKRSN